jgi:hypothetical protein
MVETIKHKKEDSEMHFYITGDTHGDFSRIAEFCETNGTDEEVKNNGTE